MDDAATRQRWRCCGHAGHAATTLATLHRGQLVTGALRSPERAGVSSDVCGPLKGRTSEGLPISTGEDGYLGEQHDV
eukprot:6188798-Pleurochrysis_carterae.AAC.4